MRKIPFGEVVEERFDTAVEHKLIEQRGPIWVLSKKCRDYYESESFIFFIRGAIEKPERNRGEVLAKIKTAETEQELQELLAL